MSIKAFFTLSLVGPVAIQLVMLYTLPIWGIILGVVILGLIVASISAGSGSGGLALIPMIGSYFVGAAIVAVMLILPKPF